MVAVEVVRSRMKVRGEFILFCGPWQTSTPEAPLVGLLGSSLAVAEESAMNRGCRVKRDVNYLNEMVGRYDIRFSLKSPPLE